MIRTMMLGCWRMSHCAVLVAVRKDGEEMWSYVPVLGKEGRAVGVVGEGCTAVHSHHSHRDFGADIHC
jgi:hypothetical protein